MGIPLEPIVARLHSLLKDPEHGCFTWHLAVNSVLNELVVAYYGVAHHAQAHKTVTAEEVEVLANEPAYRDLDFGDGEPAVAITAEFRDRIVASLRGV